MITLTELKDIARTCGFFPTVNPYMFRYAEQYAYSYVFYEDDHIRVKAWTNPPGMKKIYDMGATTGQDAQICLYEAKGIVDAIEKEKGVKDEG